MRKNALSRERTAADVSMSAHEVPYEPDRQDELMGVSAYDLTCSAAYGLTCRGPGVS